MLNGILYMHLHVLQNLCPTPGLVYGSGAKGAMMVGTAHRASCHRGCAISFKDTDVYLKDNHRKQPSESATINCSR